MGNLIRKDAKKTSEEKLSEFLKLPGKIDEL